jgi:hypothetical protein
VARAIRPVPERPPKELGHDRQVRHIREGNPTENEVAAALDPGMVAGQIQKRAVGGEIDGEVEAQFVESAAATVVAYSITQSRP